MKKLYALIIVILALNFAKGQTITQYTTADGLPCNGITAITVDLQGRIIATPFDNKLVYFDGMTWHIDPGSPDMWAVNIAVDHTNNFWIAGHYGGLHYFNGTNWTTYYNFNGYYDGGPYYVYADHHNNIWISTENAKLLKYNGINWSLIPDPLNNWPTSMNFICEDNDLNLWFGKAGQGLLKFDGMQWTINNPIINGYSYLHIYAVGVDLYGNIWTGSFDGLSKYDGNIWTHYNTSNGLANDYIGHLAFDMQGRVWATGENGGLSVFNGNTWTSIHYFDNFNIYGITIDNQGNKWFATNNGIIKYSDGGAGPLTQCRMVTGYVFYDINGNGIKDTGEVNLPGRIVELLDNTTFATTQSNCNFYFSCDTGTHEIKLLSERNWMITTDSVRTVNVTNNSDLIDSVYFGIKMINAVRDLSVDIAGNNARAGFDVNYWLNYRNNASVTQSGSVILTIDTLTSFISSIPPPDNQNGNILTWNYNGLVYLEQRLIHLILHMPGVSFLGDTIIATAIINPITGDLSPANNFDTLKQRIVGSFDPNDKIVDKGKGLLGLTSFGEELEYTIHFQNTGNDTAFLVRIRDTINNNLDISTINLVSSSHNVILDVEGHNIVTFTFNNILLPDSSINNAASNGFVKYSIKPKPGLAEHTPVTNIAYIFFDYNTPVPTNQVLNTFVSAMNPTDVIQYATLDEKGISVYPNPSTGLINITFAEKATNTKLQVLNSCGQVLLSKEINNSTQTTLDLSKQAKGMYFIKVQSGSGVEVRKVVISE